MKRGAGEDAARFAAELDLLRRQAGLSFRDLSRLTGRPVSTLNNALTGRVFPRLDTVLAIVGACGGERAPWRERWVRVGSRPPADAGPAAPRELPHLPRGFAGRERELHWLGELVASQGEPDVVIVAVHGMPGVGKTAFAVRAGHHLSGWFPDGQLFLDLGGHRSADVPVAPGAALPKLLRALGVAEPAVPTAVDEQIRLYRTVVSGRRVLMVLDDALDTEQVRHLLPGSGGSLVIATSRHRLDGILAVDGAHALRLDALSQAEADEMLAHLLGERRTAAEPEALRKLALLCGHLPLALRIAGANLAVRPHRRIVDAADELAADQLGALRMPDDPAVAVRTAFAHSYRALSPPARLLFGRLGLLSGFQVTVDLAAALGGLTRAAAGRLLEQLAARCLLEERPDRRYVMHDLVRAYAAETGRAAEPEPERAAVAERVLTWYRHVAGSAASLLYPESVRLPGATAGDEPRSGYALTGPEQAVAWLDAELPNLLVAVRYAARHSPRQAAWLLADLLRGYFVLRLRIPEWIAVAEAGLRAAREEGDARAQGAMLHSLGLACSRRGDNTTAQRHLVRALSLHRSASWPAGSAAVLVCLGSAYFQGGDLTRAAATLREGLRYTRKHGLDRLEAAALGDLGEVYRDLGLLRQARDHQLRAVQRCRALRMRRGEAVAMAALGFARADLGELNLAREDLAGARLRFAELGSPDGQAYALIGLAWVARHGGDPAAALALAERAAGEIESLGDASLVVEADLARADALQGLDKLAEAADTAMTAARLAGENGYQRGLARAWIGLACCHYSLGRVDEAYDSCRRVLRLSRERQYRLVEAQALALRAELESRAGRGATATGYASQALATQRRAGHRLGQARTLTLLARLSEMSGDHEAALRHRRDAFTAYLGLTT